ncbi:helix-turn-helix domain-containing protein [Veillonella agrestimuris]|uniref:helix-turn-helix domain-containing protein n=1 Tax=Veillonella agrestimuris TaxID=2941340 RepID=UPI00203F9C7F|nr:helix-turn-helix transcriptional regulator [Veillonella agrestimuris]
MIIFRLKEILAENGYSITFLSKVSGISRPTLTAIANNESKGVQLDTLDTICKYLNITINDLIIHIGFEFKASILEINNNTGYIKIRLHIAHYHFDAHASMDTSLSNVTIDDIDNLDVPTYILLNFQFINLDHYINYQTVITHIDDDVLYAFIDLMTKEIKKIASDNIDKPNSILVDCDFNQLERIDKDMDMAKKMVKILSIQQDISNTNK